MKRWTMKRLVAVLAALCLMMGTLTACGEAVEESSTAPEAPQETAVPKAQGGEAATGMVVDIRMQGALQNLGYAGSTAAAPDGVFHLEGHEDGLVLMFIDYATGTDSFVCTKAGCAHGEGCPSYIGWEENFAYPSIVFAGSRLLMCREEHAGLQFYEIDPATGGRSEFASLPGYVGITMGECYTDGSRLYFSAYKDDGKEQAWYAMELENGELTPVRAAGGNMWLYGGQNGTLYYKRITGGLSETWPEGMTDEQFISLQKEQRHEVVAWDTQSGNETVLAEWMQDERIDSMVDGRLYYYEQESGDLVCLDPASGEESRVAVKSDGTISYAWVRCELEGRLVVNLNYAIDQNLPEEEAVARTQVLAVDFEKGEYTDMSLNGREGYPVAVLGVGNNCVLVESNYNWDKVGSYYFPTRSLMAIEDYLAGKAEYTHVDTTAGAKLVERPPME